MSALSNRREAYDAAESARKVLFRNGDQPNHETLAAHTREGRILAVAEGIVADGHEGVAVHAIALPLDAGELAEARALAAKA